MKEKQRALIIEIMKADEEAGLYTTRKQTAVDWLVDQVENYNCMKLGLIPSDIIEKAKEMEKEQIKDAFLDIQYYTPFDSHVAFREYYKEVYGWHSE